jgi:hypothetical protein
MKSNPESSEIKLCVDCKYYHKNSDDKIIKWEYRKHSCSYYTFNSTVDLVTGQQYYGGFRFCNDMRHNDCGTDAKYYEAKQD